MERILLMKTASQIKQDIVAVLSECGVFDTVLTPPDDRKYSTIMRESSAAVYHTGCGISDDNGVQVVTQNYSIYMKFQKIGVNDTTDDIELAVDALRSIEPSSLKQAKESGGDKRFVLYLIDVSLVGCR
jgi:hypothetical protein